nr:uncharacterized protein LOC129380669 isoform X2 [Dermacentor andersoni]
MGEDSAEVPAPCDDFYSHACDRHAHSVYADGRARLMEAMTNALLRPSELPAAPAHGAAVGSRGDLHSRHGAEVREGDVEVLQKCLGRGLPILSARDLDSDCEQTSAPGCPPRTPLALAEASENFFSRKRNATIRDYAAFIERLSTHTSVDKTKGATKFGNRGCAQPQRPVLSAPWFKRACHWVSRAARCHLRGNLGLSDADLRAYQRAWKALYFAPFMGLQAELLLGFLYKDPPAPRVQACLSIMADVFEDDAFAVAKQVLAGTVDDLEGSLSQLARDARVVGFYNRHRHVSGLVLHPAALVTVAAESGCSWKEYENPGAFRCAMRVVLILLLALAARAHESEAHARHWRNYLNGLLVQLAQEPPQPDQRHELWKEMFSHRVRSFLVGDQYEGLGALSAATGRDYGYGDDENPGGGGGEGGVVGFAGRGMPDDDRLINEAWRQHVGDVLLAGPALVQRHRHSTRTSPSRPAVEVFSPYNRRTTRRTTKLLNPGSSYSPHMHRFLDIINAHGARHLREPAPQAPPLCRCSNRENETGNGSSLLAKAMTSSPTTRQPPLLLVVPGLMVAPRDGPFAIVREVDAANASDLQRPPNAARGGAASPSSPWPPMPTGKLHRRRLRSVLLLVAFVLLLSSLAAYYVRSFLARYSREYEIIRNAQFL